MEEGFSRFYQESKDRIFRAVLATTLSKSAAEEATAEAFARAFSSWSRVSEHPNPEAWVVRVALNYQRSLWRKYSRILPLGDRDWAIAPQIPSDDSGVLAMEGLTERQREAVALCVLMDLDSDTAGRILGLAPATVRVHLHRGLEKLRQTSTREETRP